MRRRSDYVRNARPRPANAVSASHQSLQDLSYRPTLVEEFSEYFAGNVKELLLPRTLGQTPVPEAVSAPLAS
jgi:hypothetical protein